MERDVIARTSVIDVSLFADTMTSEKDDRIDSEFSIWFCGGGTNGLDVAYCSSSICDLRLPAAALQHTSARMTCIASSSFKYSFMIKAI
jgi:hypothetical protein